MQSLKVPFTRLAAALLAASLYCVVLTPARAGSVADLDREDGLPDAKLGAPVESFQGLEKTDDVGRWLSYRRPSDKLVYGGFPLTGITYNFFKGKLYSIFIDVQGQRSTKGLLKYMERNFGKEYSYDKRAIPKTDVSLETREWAGTKVYLLYKCADNRAGGQITFLDKPTWDLLQIPKQEHAAEIRKKLDGSFVNGDL